jgi:hypothetical protein
MRTLIVAYVRRRLSAVPRAWLADVLARIGDHHASRLDQLLPCWGGRPNGIECANIGSNNQPSGRAAQWNSDGFRSTRPAVHDAFRQPLVAAGKFQRVRAADPEIDHSLGETGDLRDVGVGGILLKA